jgi:hypothetical protein
MAAKLNLAPPGNAMKPTRLHYFFASDFPPNLVGGALLWWLVAVVVRMIYRFAISPLRDWMEFMWLIIMILIVFPAGACGILLFLLFFVAPIYHWRAAKNGAPFRPGDRVRILVGPYRDRVAQVYAEWRYNQVRVDLGELEKALHRDHFAPYQLLRDDGPTQPSDATSLS